MKRATCNHLRKKPFLAALLSSAHNLHHTDPLRENANPLRKEIQQWKLMECIFFGKRSHFSFAGLGTIYGLCYLLPCGYPSSLLTYKFTATSAFHTFMGT